MQLFALKLVTVVTEGILVKKICDRCMALGATGFTCTEVHGSGSRAVRSDSLPGNNIRIEFVCPEPIAEQIAQYVSQHFFENYACILWISDVSVMRGDHYVKKA